MVSVTRADRAEVTSQFDLKTSTFIQVICGCVLYSVQKLFDFLFGIEVALELEYCFFGNLDP